MLPDRFDDAEYRDTAARLLPMEVARIVRLADRLRLMAPSEDGKLNVVALPPLLNDIVAIHAPAAQENRVSVSLECPETLPPILGDPSQLVQLLVNLIKNAVESMPNGGSVTIKAFERTTARTVVIEVIDDGTGIDPDLRSKIFDPLFTTRPLGTGLGLSICREIADFHRARLTLIPRGKSKGTVARVEFLQHLGDQADRLRTEALTVLRNVSLRESAQR
jgi:signal transduction histidine kinase